MKVLNPANLNVRKNVVFAVLAFGINIGLVFLSYKLVIMWGGLAALGLWSTLFAWTTMIRLGDVGMANASMRFIALCDVETEREKLGGYLQTGLLTNIALFSLLGLFGYTALELSLPRLVEAKFISEAHGVLLPMVIAFVLLNIVGVLLGSLQGLHIGYLNSAASVAGNVLQILLVSVLVPQYGVAGLAWAQVIQYACSLIVIWLIVRRKAQIATMLPLRFSREAFREMLSFSVKAQVANIANGLFEPCSKFMVGHLGGLQVLGTYELAYKTLWLPRTAIVSGASAMMPAMTALAKRDIAEIRPLYSRSVALVTGLVAVVSVIAITASPLVSILWMGSFDINYTIFMAILAVGVTLNAWGAPAYNLALVTGKMRNNIAVNIATLVLLAISSVGVYAISGTIMYSVGVVSLALGAGGIAIRLMNERHFFPLRGSLS